MGDPTTGKVPNLLVERGITAFIAFYKKSVEDMSIDAGISRLLGFQIYRLDLALRPSRTTLAPPLFWMKRLLSRKPIRLGTTNPPMEIEPPSLAWMFLGTVVLSETIERLSDINFEDIQHFTVWICDKFYKTTAELLKKMRNAKMDSVEEDWATLNENLTAIYLLTMYRSLRKKLHHRLGRSATDQRTVAPVQNIQKILLGPTGDAIDDLTSNEDAIKLMDCVRDRVSFFDQYSAAMKEEAWDYLRDYAQHWLEKMGEGPGCFDRVMVNTFHLNTLIRVGEEPESSAPPDICRPSIQNVFEEAFTFYHQTLDPGHKDQQDRIRRYTNVLGSGFESETAHITNADHLGLVNVRFSFSVLRFVEVLIESEQGKKGPSEGKDRKIKAPEDFPEDSLGFLEPPVAEGDDFYEGPMFKKVLIGYV